MSKIILEMERITKAFPGVKALKGVSFDLREGEVHALLGENGAGKSTLMNCLSGICDYDSGEIRIDGKPARFASPVESLARGISIIHQELALAEQLTVADNIFAGREPLGRFGLIDQAKLYDQTNGILDSIDANFDSRDRVFTLSTAQKQMLAIAKAISHNARILVMDEPTASVSYKEVEKIYQLVTQLRAAGITIVYISHRMDDIFRVADRITVLRDGANVKTVEAGEVTRDGLVRMMVGYSLDRFYTKRHTKPGEVILSVENLTRRDGRVRNASITLRKGEILGIGGLVGSGRSELVESLFGLTKIRSGRIMLHGAERRFSCPEDALDAGICLVPEDRKHQGLVLNNTVKFNLTLGVLDQFFGPFGVDPRKEDAIAGKYIKMLSIKVPSLLQHAIKLSGGNQQKVVLGKWLAANAGILILDEPTRGIDVGAKAEIYALMDSLTGEGVSIIFVSSDLPEVLNMSDRLYVMREGGVIAMRNRGEFDREEILSYALGVKSDG